MVGVETSNGFIKTPKVLNAAGGFLPLIAAMVDLKLQSTVIQMQDMVTEPLKPFFNVTLVSFDYDVFGSQTLKGELVTGSEMDHWFSYTTLPLPIICTVKRCI